MNNGNDNQEYPAHVFPERVEDDYNYQLRINNNNNNNNNEDEDDDDDDIVATIGGIVLTKGDIQRNLRDREKFLQIPGVHDGSDKDGQPLPIFDYPHRMLTGCFEYLYNLTLTGFNRLSPVEQNQVANIHTSHACVLFSVNDILARQHERGNTEFSVEDIASLSQTDLLIGLEVRPILKTIYKFAGENSLRSRVGGSNDSYVQINQDTPTFLRLGKFVAFLFSPNISDWDDIVLHENGEILLAEGKAEAERQLLHPCVLFLVDDILERQRERGIIGFTVEDIASLTQADLLIGLEVRPILKTLYTFEGENSLEAQLGGGSRRYSLINHHTATLLRSNVFAAVHHDSNVIDFDDIVLHENGPTKLAEGKAEAERQLLHACVLFLVDDILERQRERGIIGFTVDDIPNLTQADLLIGLEVRPILKTLYKSRNVEDHSLSLEAQLGGGRYSLINHHTATLLRSNVFAAVRHDSNVIDFDDIIIHENGPTKLAEGKAEAERLATAGKPTNGTYYVYDNANETLLAVIDGIGQLFETVGGSLSHQADADGLQQLIRTSPNGRFLHRKISDTEYAFFICTTPLDDTEDPVEDGEARIQELVQRARHFYLGNFYWIIYPGDAQPVDDTQSQGHGVGVNPLRRKLFELVPEAGRTDKVFQCHWHKSPTYPKLRGHDNALSSAMWARENVNGLLYNSKAGKWVKVVETEEEWNRLVGENLM